MAAPALDKYADLKSAAAEAGITDLQISQQGDKIQVTGTASHELGKNELWNAIKKHSGWENEISANIKVTNTDIHGVYTVKSGDTLSKIAKYIYGDANAYPRIFDANKDILKDPDKIQVGQKLKLPK
jgi:nucleoid-associated protein YgaU